MWLSEQQDGYNPFDEINKHFDETMAGQRANDGKDWTRGDDGWTDYRENVNELDVQEERERHEDKFDPDAFKKSMYGGIDEEKGQEEEDKKEDNNKA